MQDWFAAAVVGDGVHCTVAEETWVSLSELAKDASRMHKVRTEAANKSLDDGLAASDGVLHHSRRPSEKTDRPAGVSQALDVWQIPPNTTSEALSPEPPPRLGRLAG